MADRLSAEKMSLPRRIIVETVLDGRYDAGAKPVGWDDRKDGVDRIVCVDGEIIELYSSGAQSTPAKGWELLLTNTLEVDSGEIQETESKQAILYGWTLYGWTLYGLKPNLVYSRGN